VEGNRGASTLKIDTILDELAGTRFARIDARASTESTNEDALRVLDDAAAGLTICADYQTRGAGRKAGRRWIAPAGSSLLMTTVLPAKIQAQALWAVPFWAGVCAHDALEEVLGVEPCLRWPNDLLLGERKCAGILCVSRVSGAFAHVGCGIGINVVRPEDDPELAAVNPAFLSDLDPAITRERVLLSLLKTYDAYWPLLTRLRELIVAWELRAQLASAVYRLRLDETGEILEGEALRLGPDGALIVRVNGAERAVALAGATVT
jgi:BirA family transcriptional regulator, biotin operon repressor / biotin---[acetyl-CoA-carboxylase] ligase